MGFNMDERQSRRTALIRLGELGLALGAAAAFGPDALVQAKEVDTPPPQSRKIQSKAYNGLSSEERRHAGLRIVKASGWIEPLGGIYSDFMDTRDGCCRVLLKDALLEIDFSRGSRLSIAPVLDELHWSKLNEVLESGKYGIPVPRPGLWTIYDEEDRARRVTQRAFDPSRTIEEHLEWLKGHRISIDPGDLRSGAKYASGTEIYRTEGLAFTVKGAESRPGLVVQQIPIAKTVIGLGLIPEEAILRRPTEEIDDEMFYQYRNGSYDIKGLIRLFAEGNPQTGEPEMPLYQADTVCWCESKYNTETNGDGMWQVIKAGHEKYYNPRGWSHDRDSRNPYRNTIVAKEIKRVEGFAAWTCWRVHFGSGR